MPIPVRLGSVSAIVRLHWQNLINAAVLPLTFENEADHDQLEQGDVLLRLIRLNPSQSVTATLSGGDWTTWPNIGKNGALRAGLVFLVP